MTYEFNPRSRYQSKLLKFLAGAVLAGGVVGVAFDSVKKLENNVRLIESHKSTISHSVERGDTYWDYAKNLKEQYPQLAGLDVNDLAREIQKVNDNKSLNYSGSVLLPVYNFPKSEGD